MHGAPARQFVVLFVVALSVITRIPAKGSDVLFSQRTTNVVAFPFTECQFLFTDENIGLSCDFGDMNIDGTFEWDF